MEPQGNKAGSSRNNSPSFSCGLLFVSVIFAVSKSGAGSIPRTTDSRTSSRCGLASSHRKLSGLLFTPSTPMIISPCLRFDLDAGESATVPSTEKSLLLQQSPPFARIFPLHHCFEVVDLIRYCGRGLVAASSRGPVHVVVQARGS